MRAPVAIINFTFFVRDLLVESYINSEIFTGILIIATGARTTPIIEILSPLTKTPLWKPLTYVHYSLSKFTGEWFINHSNHLTHILTPITRVVATKRGTDHAPSNVAMRPKYGRQVVRRSRSDSTHRPCVNQGLSTKSNFLSKNTFAKYHQTQTL